MLSDPSKRPPTLRDLLLDDVVNHVPRTLLALDEDKFGKNLRSTKRGAAAGPSGMTIEHIRPLLENVRILHSFFQMCERLAQANVPQVADGGVRGIVDWTIGTIAQQMVKAVESATAPNQCALSTRAVCECRLVRAEPAGNSDLHRWGAISNKFRALPCLMVC